MPYGDGSPELKDGFSRITNETLDALARTSLSDYESRCIHLLWRKTYGWRDGNGESKKEDIIAYSQWADGTGIDRRSVRRILQGLLDRNIFTKKTIKRPGKNPLTIWAFQKYYHKWSGFQPNFQLQLGAVSPLLENEVGAILPPVDVQVGVELPPVSFEVGVISHQVGAVLPPEVGAILPPTIDNKDTTTKDILLLKGNDDEKLMLASLKKLNGWVFNLNDDIEWLRELAKDYPSIDNLTIKACGDYHSEKSVKKGPWKNRLRQWLQHDIDFGKNNQPTGKYGKGGNNGHHGAHGPGEIAKDFEYIESE